ncbi:MAG: nucleotide exchange factor GrpE [Bacteroidota bacterium]
MKKDNNKKEDTTQPSIEPEATATTKDKGAEGEPEQEAEEDKKEDIPDDQQSKYNELNDRYLRLYSEFDNYKRRTTKERIELYKSAGEDIVIALLPVIDDFERALKSNEETNDVGIIKEGVKLVYSKMINILAQKGLGNMDSMKKKFDTDLHEAITKIPAPSRKLRGKVVDVIEKGYLFNNKVIRYAKVVVGN